MSNWHTVTDEQKTLTEERAKRAIDTLLSYRRGEVLLTFGMVWISVLLMTFTLLATVRAAMTFPLF